MNNSCELHYAQGKALPYMLGHSPAGQASIRRYPDDFIVREILGFSPSGEGQHAFIQVQKRGLTTDEVVKRLVEFCAARPMDVGYAGLKDKNALTEQWFSVDLQGKSEPRWQEIEDPTLRVLQVTRNLRKLKVGALRGNEFEIVLRDFLGDSKQLLSRIEALKHQGVPNYFGEQRFGRAGDNAVRAAEFFAGQYRPKSKHERGILLSAARSWLFNQVLAQRVRAGDWNQALPGDVMMLTGSHSVFSVGELNDEVISRVLHHDIHPTGPMWGIGELMSVGVVADLERTVAARQPSLCAGLELWNLRQERRALVLQVQELKVYTTSDGIKCSFQLESGAYATTILREIVQYHVP